jgi:hypothetical protein
MAVAVAAGTCWSVQGLGGIQLLGRYLEACLRAEPVPVSVERPHGGDDRHKACDKKRRKTPAPPPVRGRRVIVGMFELRSLAGRQPRVAGSFAFRTHSRFQWRLRGIRLR